MGVEVWRDIPGYEGLYQVSTQGNVKSLRRNGNFLKPRKDHKGYMNVALTWKCKSKHFKVHRLVALAFIPNPENKRTVNHIDGNKENNNLENLEWATHSENIIHANKIGLRKVSELQRKAASITGKRTCALNRPRKAVYCIKDGIRRDFVSAHEGARYVSGSASPIVACCKGKKSAYKGYEWGYA